MTENQQRWYDKIVNSPRQDWPGALLAVIRRDRPRTDEQLAGLIVSWVRRHTP